MRNPNVLVFALALLLPVASLAQTNPTLEARAKELALDTPYTPPPGDPLSHHAAGYAQVICSALFVTGLELDFAVENVGIFTSPPEERARFGKPEVDRAAKAVHVKLPDGRRRSAVYAGDQGCANLQEGADKLSYTPLAVPDLPKDGADRLWPMGDRLPAALPAEVDARKVAAALDAAFQPAAAQTAAVVATWRGQLIGERYAPGIMPQTPLEGWSMGKSLTATLMGILIQQGVYTLKQPAPIPEWQQPGDPRQAITIENLLNMSSGLKIRAPQDPDYVEGGPYPDHFYYYTGSADMFRYAATRPQQWPPGKVGRYRNTDPVLTNYLIRLAVEKRGEPYHAFPQRALFDKLGIRSMVMETDPFGNFLTQGYELGSARDWARLGNLYLQDGMWQGERILPEAFVKFVRTLAPAWVADARPIYGGFFWINGDGGWPAPKDAYFMAGAGGQFTFILPSHDLVVVRLGHSLGGEHATEGFNKALALLQEAVPKKAAPAER